ncbi:MAG TPA: efflux RND transporter periplasmic adaptor subunit [Vicinamibacterales bacterium]|nr:efflux RND transporter periplasmic adaptor subunit [Vicinamibacterales bacterium]
MLIVAAVMMAACSSEAKQQTPAQAAGAGGRGRGDAAPVPVTTTTAVEKSMPVTVAAVGNAEAISTVQVRSQVTGRLAQIQFAEGQDVEAGQLLFTIDPQPFQVALDQATAVLARDTAQSNNAQAQVERYENLFMRGLIPKDQYETQVATATALKATTEADAAAIAAAKLNLQYTKILAPAAGRTGALLVHQGDLVQANGTAPLVVINQVAPIYVSFAVPGKLLDDIRRYQRSTPLRVTAQLPGDEGTTVEAGKLTFIDNAVDPQTGTIKLKATFTNAQRRLWPGQSADVRLQLHSDPHAIVIPSVAVQASQQGPYVWAVNQGRVQMKPISIARVEGEESVVDHGVAAGDVVVTDGQLRLTPNSRIAERTEGDRGGRGAAEAQ